MQLRRYAYIKASFERLLWFDLISFAKIKITVYCIPEILQQSFDASSFIRNEGSDAKDFSV